MKRTLVLLLGAVAVMSTLTLIIMVTTDQSLDEFPSWLEAFSTLAAFAAAVVAVRYAHEAWQVEERRDARYEQARMSEQASLVGAWYEPGLSMRGGPVRPGVWIRNASNLPVDDVEVQLTIQWLGGMVNGTTMKIGTVPPSDEPQFSALRDDHESEVGAARLRYLQARQEHLNEHPQDTPFVPESIDPSVELTFRDSASVEWYRGVQGLIMRHQPPWC